MCRYCNFDIYTHYLINGKSSLEGTLNIGTELDESLKDLAIIEISATEDAISKYKLEDNAINSGLKGEKEYSASFIDGEELPDWISLDSNTGQFTIQPKYEVIGTHEIIVQVTNEFGESVNSVVLLEVAGKDGQESLLEGDNNISIKDNTVLGNINSVATQEAVTQPQISINNVQTTDSSAGRELTFTVSLNVASNETITVDYATADNTAVEGEDYTAVNNIVTFAPGETSKTITVNTTGTSYLDDDESFLVNLSNAINATIADEEGEGVILPAYAGIRGWQRSQEVVTFSFFDESVFGQGGYDGSTRESNAREVSEVVKSSYRQIFDHLNTFVDREFIEVAESESEVGHIRIVVSDAPDYAYAGGHIHLAGWAAASDSGINGWESVPGGYGYVALLHELGHALGMPHTFGKDSSVFDPEENSSNSVMSYTFPGNHPGTFMAYDIKSLQERYGADEYRNGDTVYEFLTVDKYTVDEELAIDTPSRLKQTIWDSSGIDTFDFSSLTFDDSGYRFDLNQAKFQTTQSAYQGSSYTRDKDTPNEKTYYVPTYGTSIAIDVEIENLINSSSDDIIIANPTANNFSGYLPELTTGNDVLIGTDSLDTLYLSAFAFTEVEEIPINNDLKIDLGDSNSVTIADYYTLPTDNRINIVYKQEGILFAVAPPVVSVEDITVYEADSNTTAMVTVSLDKAVRSEWTVDYNTADNGSAVAYQDYIPAIGTLTFNPGEISKTVPITIIGDSLNEGIESIHFETGFEDATIFIHDNDGETLPEISVQDAGVLSSIPIKSTDINGNVSIKNTTGLLFKISLDSPSNQTIKVDYATADGTAIAEEDYSSKNKTLTFQPGETEKQVFVGVTVDDIEEVDENLYLNLSNPVYATIADNQAVGTIEETRSLSVSDLEVSEDGTEALFTISLDKPSVQGVFVNYSTADGTAKAGADYEAISGRLLIKAGKASATVAVPLINNNLTELDETFFLNLSKPKYVLIEDEQGQATIVNDDAISTHNPGGIYQNLQLWLKADGDITTDNEQVVTWGDNSQAEINLGQDDAESRPTLTTNGLNYNPIVSFDGDNDTLTSLNTLPAGFAKEDVSIYIISQSDRANQRSSILAATPDSTYGRLLVHLPYSGNAYFDQGNIHGSNGGRLSTSFDTPNSFQMWNFQTETEVGQSILLNGLEIASDDNTSSSFNSFGKTLELSSLISADAFEGDIAEVIIFNQALNQSDRNAVDSYLGIKYGFTLDQTTPTNYVTSDGAIIWDAIAAGNYNQDVAGIAIDNASDLNQIKSRSSNDDGIVTIGNASDLDNGEALIWSNDDGAIDAESVSLTNGNYYISRQWQVQSTGNVGTVDLSFDLTGLGYLTDNADEFALLIDDDGNFSDASSINTGLEVNGNEVSFSNISLQDGSYFTLAVPEKRSPGGIKSNLQLWLRGDSIITNNDSVTQWRDRSGKNRNYTPKDVDNQPVLDTEEFNFNSAVSFDGNDTLTTSRTNFTQGEVFFVLKGQDNGGSSGLLNDTNYYNTSHFKFEQWWNKGKLGFSRSGIADYTSNLDSPVGQLSLVSFNSDVDSNIINLAVENNGILSQDSLDIGASNPISIQYLAQGFKGEIAEVIIFDDVLSDTDKLQLRSNLAIKYGLNLDLNSDYVNSDNQIWWNANLAGEYHNDVAGIAVDDSSDLAQTKSRSSNTNSIITIEAEDTLNGLEDREALIWGNKDQDVSNYVLQLDGSNDYGKIPDSDAIDFAQDENFTVEVRVKTDGSTASDAIVEKWGHGGGYSYVIRYQGDGTVKAARYDGSNNPGVVSTTKINDGEFHNISFVKEGDELKLYIDGKLENTTTDTTTGTTTNNSPVYLGSRGGYSEFFNGSLEDVRIWNTARSTTEIQSSLHDVDADSNGLVAYLPLENDGNDLTSNSNNATFHNEAAITPVNAINLSKRIWQVQENQGDVGKVSVSFDLSQLGEQLTLEDYALQISDDDSFNDFQFHTLGSTIDGNTLTFTGVDFDNGEYFTLNTEYSKYVNSINGTDSNDFLIGTADAEIINGYGGNDRFRSGNGNDTIDGGAGRDVLIEASKGDFLLTDDLLTSNRGTDSFTNIEVVILRGRQDDNFIDGSGVNTLRGVFYGDNGNDTLIGGNANNVLRGGGGKDILYGKGGINILIGNNGADIFALEPNSGRVIIRDFNNDVDSLGLTSSLGFNDLIVMENTAGTATLIRDKGNNNAVIAVIQNIDPSDLTRDDFITI